MKKIIGVYGLSGSGKTTFCKRLAELSCIIIDADAIGREILEKGSPLLSKVEKTFGSEYLNEDGSLNRKKLGKTVFSDGEKLELLNSITKPEINRIIKERALAIKEGIVIIDCALIEEFEIKDILDELVLIRTSPKVLIDRLITRDGLERSVAEGRIKLQTENGFSEFTRVIENDKGIEELIKKADDFYNEMKG